MFIKALLDSHRTNSKIAKGTPTLSGETEEGFWDFGVFLHLSQLNLSLTVFSVPTNKIEDSAESALLTDK